SGRPASERGAPAHASTPGLPLLLGHVPGDGRAVQRLALRRHLARGSGADLEGAAGELYPAGPGSV
ncbi:Maltodextrin ABC transporter, substrate-binding protein MdxE, partial [uncultured Rubrobacteraceae bacterium]